MDAVTIDVVVTLDPASLDAPAAITLIVSLVVGRVLAILGHGKGGPGTAKRDRARLAKGRAH